MKIKLNINNKYNKGPARNATHNVAGGYTIIETMISISLFLVVVTIGMNSLLNANVILNKSKDVRSIMDNLSFIVEDMSRNIRTGTDYRCDLDVTNVNAKSCISGGVFSFTEAISGDRWAYKIEGPILGPFHIYKTINAVDPIIWVQLTDDAIILNETSGFSVLGAEPQPGNNQQPFVMIRLAGEIQYKETTSPFSLQTSVSQRTPDVFP